MSDPQIPESGLDYLKQLGRAGKAAARPTADGGLELMPDGTTGIFDEGRNTPVPASSAETRIPKAERPRAMKGPLPNQPATPPPAAPSSPGPAPAPGKAEQPAARGEPAGPGPDVPPKAAPPAATPPAATPAAPAAAVPPPAPPAPPTPSPEETKARLETYRKTFIERSLPAPTEPTIVPLPADVKAKARELRGEGKDDEADQLIATATMKLSVKTAEDRLATREATESFVADRAEANMKVFERHPELLEFEEKRLRGEAAPLVDTPFTRELQNVYAELGDNFISTHPRAPLIAMEMTETRLKDKGKLAELAAATATADAATKAEHERGATAMAGSAAGGGAVPGAQVTQPVSLDAKQMRVAMRMRMAPEEYARLAADSGPVVDLNWAKNARPRRPA